ncbi:MAG TPA: oligosaccharide flippase family protein, partial [Ktedonobacteraceae bacterium]|nr:oligosaccharide flippase family protein [Ktedonobacteraceae bacterium]
MSTFHVEIPPEMLTTSPLFATVVERTETQPLQAFQQQAGVESRLRNREFVPDTPDHEVYSVSQFLEHATIPLIASEATTNHAEPAALVTKSEISGTANNAAIVGVGNIVGFLFKYGNNLLIQHALGVALFGLYSVSLSLVTLLGSIFDLGLDNTVIRYISVYRGKKQKSMMRHLLTFCTGMAAITGTLGAVLVLFFASSLANFVHKPDTIPLLQIMAPVVPLLCMQTVWTSGLQGLKEFKRRVLIQRFVVPLTLFALTAIALFFFRNLTGVAILAFCSTLISTIINLYFLFAAVNRIKGSEDGRYETRSWLSFALPNFLTTIVNTALDSIDTLLLAFFVAANAIGLYAAAIKISNFILIPLATMNIVFTPTIAEL